jgi:arylformamidase
MEFDLEYLEAIDISIPMRFNEAQPNAWGVERATSLPVKAGVNIGDTRKGGSVNFEQYTFIPHCSGTHTECVGHITHERITITDCLQDILVPALLVTVDPRRPSTLSLRHADTDRVIERDQLEPLLRSADSIGRHTALIVRTQPNDDRKETAEYGENNIPAYFAPDAMDLIVENEIKHLLVDLPSIDRLFDDGKLANHRKFWQVEHGSHEVNSNTRINSTITELIYVPDSVADGEYLLNLQIAPFRSDCSPSRPILLKNI